MENLIVSTRKKLTMDKMFSNVKITAQNTISKILNVRVKSAVTSAECENGTVSIGGKIIAEILYLTDENQIETASGSVEFLEKQKSAFALTEIFAESAVEIDNVNYSSNEAMISVSHTAEIIGVYGYEIPKIDASENKLVIASSTFPLKHIVTAPADTFIVSEDYQTNLDNANILSANASVVISSVSAGVDKVVVEGKIISEVVYFANDVVDKMVKEFDFKQDVSASGVVPNMTADALGIVKNTIVTAEMNNEKVTFVYSIELGLRAYVYDETTFELASDMYSLKSELQTTYSYLEMKNYKGTKNSYDTFASTIDISNIENLDDVIGVFDAGTKINEVEQDNGQYKLNCSQKVYVLYKTENGINNLDTELNFAIESDIEQDAELSNYNVSAQLVSFKVKAGREIEIMSKFNYGLKFETQTSQKYISGYEITGEKTEDVHGIKVYVAKDGQSVFEVAKILNVTPETIREQNEIDEIFEAGQKIYVYSPVNLA